MDERESMERFRLVSATLVSAALVLGTQVAESAAAAPAGTIVYSVGASVHTMRPDGNGDRKLPMRLTDLSDPAWSWHGRKLAFDGRGIYTANANGTGLKQLTSGAHDFDPSWCPGGRMLVFDRRTSAGSAIMRINADGSGIKRLTNYKDVNYFPTWSPTANKIAYHVVQHPGGGLHVMNSDGTGDKAVSDAATNYFALSWPRDGKSSHSRAVPAPTTSTRRTPMAPT